MVSTQYVDCIMYSFVAGCLVYRENVDIGTTVRRRAMFTCCSEVKGFDSPFDKKFKESVAIMFDGLKEEVAILLDEFKEDVAIMLDEYCFIDENPVNLSWSP